MDSSQQSILSPPGHAHDHRSASRRSLSIALALIMVYMVVEVVGGLISGSLALLADAGHMLTDGAAIGLALLAIWVSGRPASIEQTFGFHRTEILAAMLNALSLWLISALIFFEASRRFNDDLQVDGGLMLGVGAVGLLVNLAAAWALHRSSGESLNVEGAFLHVVADLLGSVAVVAGGILVLAFEWNIADPIFGIVIGVLILASSLRLLWKVVHVLMEGTPSHLDLHHLCQRLEELEGVTGVHDIHAWTITTGYDALSAHVTADPTVMQDPNPVLQALRDIASSEFGIGHVTIQLEDSKDGCVEDHHIEHPAVHGSSHRHDES
ncbi:MAG: cation diffusion facilitator family transporter [Dehalococcoidia bacterium]|jgi:cobalt-zinc-cadmium efflux system protein|nr:cation diffusion facilitator family transporter [Dehalococcoidia bacterium]